MLVPKALKGNTMAVCGPNFTIVVTELGDVFAWGDGYVGQLGLNTREQQVLPAFVAGREVFGARMVMVAAGASTQQA